MKKIVLSFLLAMTSFILWAQKPYSSFNHISIHVNNLDKSVSFYTKLFQLDSIPDPFPQFRVTWFKLGKHLQFHIFEDKEMVNVQESYHFCFSVSSMDEFIANLKKENIEYFDGSGQKDVITLRSDKVKQIYFKDPDGHKIEVNDSPF